MANTVGGSDVSLLLDPQIRDWVLFPITLVMVLVGVLRVNVVQLLQSPPKRQKKENVRETSAILRGGALRQTAQHSPLPPAYFLPLARQLATNLEEGAFLKDKPKDTTQGPSAPPNPLSDPAAMEGMMSGMKTQMVMMVPQMVIMGWINFFFQGFVLINLPFPLPATSGFKSLLQRGIQTPDMDVRWVSSLSWYFLNFFGLNGLLRLLVGGDDGVVDPMAAMSPMTPMMPTGPGAPDASKAHKAEAENIRFAESVYKWVGDDVETRVLSRYGMK
ncbi:uncharacterized protein SCHCODRAFT_02622612 [Schizophyllum commune H4-8]|uniref:ER membrane protein complex subunit 3 n=1 Tax=Schizophyllum commune (strain H4-8 / FGSC 9210) TaxID=578458 RepID=D8PR22_SCHCM|nr:uncharacterized protein SCHCODRAFT_02622612 [Schizophyllum commune H4-8]KAI5893734.1 transmembrane protein [Schizophyllum commune H4-8]